MLISKLESRFKIKIKLEKININNFNSLGQIKKLSKTMKKKKNKLINNLFSKLWPINRSITGPGFHSKVYALFKKRLNLLKIKKIKSGTKVFDWVIPKVWNVSEAWIKDEKGKKILDFKKNNLHLMGYSSPCK